MNNSEPVVGKSGGLKSTFEKASVVAGTDMPVLLLGETGSGKEVVARSIHQASGRVGRDFIRVNCGAISPDLIDSELFGHEKGSFTGATSSRKGWFERADGGTLFLDEIGEMSESVQVRLLRILQDGTFDRIGGTETVKVNVRVIAATHRNLFEMVQKGKFREDLWYRISSFPIAIPALRERLEDIPELAQVFVNRYANQFGVPTPRLSQEDIEVLRSYSWPGNVREIEAVLARAVLLSKDQRLDVRTALGVRGSSVPTSNFEVSAPAAGQDVDSGRDLNNVTRLHIENTLRDTHGRIDGPFGAAKILKIHPNTLRSRMKKLNVDPRRFKKSA